MDKGKAVVRGVGEIDPAGQAAKKREKLWHIHAMKSYAAIKKKEAELCGMIWNKIHHIFKKVKGRIGYLCRIHVKKKKCVCF